MRSDLEMPSHGERLSAWHYQAESDAWTTPAGRPCVLMAHGFGATKDTGLAPFAERFAAAGADVVVFDYRGFGPSTGTPRQLVDHRRHRADYRAALAHVRGMPGIDPTRVVLWGSSYSGGHVVAVGAQDRRIAGVIAQGAAMDGLAAVLQILSYAGPVQLTRLTAHALRGVVQRSYSIPIVADPGEVAAITSPDGRSGYEKITGPSFVNHMPARCVLPIMRNRPVTSAPRLTAPLMLVMAEHDTIAPPSAVEKVARTAGGPVTLLRLDVGHFDIYLGEPFETSVAAQLEFLTGLFTAG